MVRWLERLWVGQTAARVLEAERCEQWLGRLTGAVKHDTACSERITSRSSQTGLPWRGCRGATEASSVQETPEVDGKQEEHQADAEGRLGMLQGSGLSG